MAVVKIPDDCGDTLTLVEYDGDRYPAFQIDTISGVSSTKIRPDDILICAYPKSGIHWVAEAVYLILSGSVDQTPENRPSGLIEKTKRNYLDALPSPRILGTHVSFGKLPAEVVQKSCKIVEILRNPKDVVVSNYNMIQKMYALYQYEGSWENYFRGCVEGKFDYGSWFDYVRGWEKGKINHPDMPILTLWFEDLKKDPSSQLKKLSSFLEQKHSNEFLELVTAKTSLDKMKKAYGDKNPFYRKGQVGDWKNWFTVAQNEWFDRLYQEKMADSTLKPKFELNNH